MLATQLSTKIVRKVGKLFIKTFLMHRLPKPFHYEEGIGWRVDLPRLRHRADCSEAVCQSPMLIYDNGVALSPHALHKNMSAGCFSHWGQCVFFLPSDKSDPNTNGRTYTYSMSRLVYRRYAPASALPASVAGANVPTNYRTRDASPQALQDDVAYALQIARGYLRWITGHIPSLAGLKVLELGPGINFGPGLYLACHGAMPMVTDRFLAEWDPGYHLPLYTLMRDRLRREEPHLDMRPLDSVIAARGYPNSVIVRRECSAEKLDFPDDSVDLVFSNAVFEHLWDTRKSIEQLHRITRPGGWGFHQVDFRYHPDFSRPLEHLLLSHDEFKAMFEAAHGEPGTCLRPLEMGRLFEAAGFRTVFTGNMPVAPAYMKEFLPRLRAAGASPYRDFPAEELQQISGLFRVQKPA